jgi:hypothetical protein
LLNIADVVKDGHFIGVEAAEFALKQQDSLRSQQFVHQVKGGDEENTLCPA